MSMRLTQVSALTHGVRLARPVDELVVELTSRRKTQVVTNSRFVYGETEVICAPRTSLYRSKYPRRPLSVGRTPAKPRRSPLRVIAELPTAYAKGPMPSTVRMNSR